MNEERLKHLGRLTSLRSDESILRVRITSLVSSLRSLLDQFADIEELRGEQIAVNAAELANALLKHKEISGKIAAIEKAMI